MASKVEIKPTSTIIANLGLSSNGTTLKWFTSEVARAMDKYVPMLEGNLREYNIQDNLIIYDVPYARYQYGGVSKSGKKLNYTKDFHPLATHHWDKVMWSAEGNDLVMRLQDYIKRG